MWNLTVNLQRLHDKKLWSVQACLVQIACGELVVQTFAGGHVGVGAAAVVIAMALQVGYMACSYYTVSHATADLAEIPDRERHHPVAVSPTASVAHGKDAGHEDNPGSLRASG
ncbi:MAG: hypothetical protein ACXWWG_00665 [Nitrospira sp.]